MILALFTSSLLFFFLNLFIIYCWLCWVFVSVRGLSLVAASGGHSSSRCAGLSLSRPLLLRSTGSRRAGSVVGAHGPSCSAACGIFPDQGSNPCPLHWQADCQPLRHQGSPPVRFLIFTFLLSLARESPKDYGACTSFTVLYHRHAFGPVSGPSRSSTKVCAGFIIEKVYQLKILAFVSDILKMLGH